MKRLPLSSSATFKSLSFRGKLQFIWDYYKLALFLIVVVLYFFGYLVYRNTTTVTPKLYLAFVNVDIGEDLKTTLTDGFIQYIQPVEKNSVVKTYEHLSVTDNLTKIDASYLQASQLKILAAIDSEQLDVVLMNQEAFDAFSQNGYLINLNLFSQSFDSEPFRPYFIENLEILSDNATEVLLDASVPYKAETDTYPMGINVSEFPCIKQAGFPETVYLGILSNTPRPEEAAAFLNYIMNTI